MSMMVVMKTAGSSFVQDPQPITWLNVHELEVKGSAAASAEVKGKG